MKCRKIRNLIYGVKTCLNLHYTWNCVCQWLTHLTTKKPSTIYAFENTPLVTQLVQICKTTLSSFVEWNEMDQ